MMQEYHLVAGPASTLFDVLLELLLVRADCFVGLHNWDEVALGVVAACPSADHSLLVPHREVALVCRMVVDHTRQDSVWLEVVHIDPFALQPALMHFVALVFARLAVHAVACLVLLLAVAAGYLVLAICSASQPSSSLVGRKVL